MPAKSPSRKHQQLNQAKTAPKARWKYQQFQRLDRQRRAHRGK
jgi:hypothetical protein